MSLNISNKLTPIPNHFRDETNLFPLPVLDKPLKKIAVDTLKIQISIELSKEIQGLKIAKDKLFLRILQKSNTTKSEASNGNNSLELPIRDLKTKQLLDLSFFVKLPDHHTHKHEINENKEIDSEIAIIANKIKKLEAYKYLVMQAKIDDILLDPASDAFHYRETISHFEKASFLNTDSAKASILLLMDENKTHDISRLKNINWWQEKNSERNSLREMQSLAYDQLRVKELQLKDLTTLKNLKTLAEKFPNPQIQIVFINLLERCKHIPEITIATKKENFTDDLDRIVNKVEKKIRILKKDLELKTENVEDFETLFRIENEDHVRNDKRAISEIQNNNQIINYLKAFVNPFDHSNLGLMSGLKRKSDQELDEATPHKKLKNSGSDFERPVPFTKGFTMGSSSSSTCSPD